MNEQQGSFQGVGTYNLRKHGDFSLCLIVYCPDINALLTKLKKENILSLNIIKMMKERSHICSPNDLVINKYLDGRVYVPLVDQYNYIVRIC